MELILLFISFVIVNNFVLSQFLGVCPFLGVSKKIDAAFSMGLAVTFVMSITAAASWAVNNFILKKFGLEILEYVVFILVIASLVQFVEMFLKKSMPALYAGLGIFLPLITTNCAVMGACLINIKEDYTFIETIISSFSYAVGFGLALILFAGVRERILLAKVPKPLQDTSIGLITAGIIAMAFFAFKGMV